MWLKLALNGIILSLRITGYRKPNQNDPDEAWCTTEFSLSSEPWLNYVTDGELLLSRELDELCEALDALLHNRMSSPMEISCMEPDFCFVLTPQKNLRVDLHYIYVQPGYEFVDINLEWKVSFWYNGGLTSNYLSLMLHREDIEHLHTYLKLVTGAIQPDAPEVLRLVAERVIY